MRSGLTVKVVNTKSDDLTYQEYQKAFGIGRDLDPIHTYNNPHKEETTVAFAGCFALGSRDVVVVIVSDL
jgi:hypothetical protein